MIELCCFLVLQYCYAWSCSDIFLCSSYSSEALLKYRDSEIQWVELFMSQSGNLVRRGVLERGVLEGDNSESPGRGDG
jgi:hypothetical protein